MQMGNGTVEQVNYVTTGLTLSTLIARIVLSLWRRERIDASFFLVVASILGVVARIVLNIYYLAYGNASDALKHPGDYDEGNVQRIRTGTILVLVARALITTVLWLQISILLLFYSRITFGFRWVACMVKVAWAAVAVTYVAVILVTFLECRPISLYWQVMPDPGSCAQAYAQLFVQTCSNILLDVLLIIIAWPVLRMKKRTVTAHVTIYTLFALGTFCIVISIIRLVSVRDSDSSQTTRSLWAAAQLFVSTFVANAPSIYGSVRALRARRRNRSGNHNSTTIQGTANNDDLAVYAMSRRTQPDFDSWLKMDDERLVMSMASSAPAYMLRPLPRASTFFDEDTAPAPYSHSPSLELVVASSASRSD